MENLEINNLFGGIYKGRKVLVTGHTGFKGSWLIYWLHKLSAELFGLSLDSPTSPNHISLLNFPHVSYIQDINDKEKVFEILQKVNPDIIFHLAAQPLVIASYENPYYTYDTNIMGLINLFEIIRKVDFVKSVVIITSDKCYKIKDAKNNYSESDELGGFDPYSSSKSCAEIISASYTYSFLKSKNINIATARAGNVIGGGDWAENRLIPDCIKSLNNKTKIIIRKPDSVRPWQFILEPISGYLLLGQKISENADNSFSSWNFGPSYLPENVINIVRKITRLWGAKENIELQESDSRFFETDYLYLNIDNAKKYLNWEPVYNLRNALDKTVVWYKKVYGREKDVYNLCKSQIIEYTATAKNKKIFWAQ